MQPNSSFKPLLMIAAVTTLGSGTLTLPSLTQAELSASFGAANLYLWRGTNLSDHAPQVHGSLDYSNSGFYAGIWGSNETIGLGQEYDLYLGYTGEAGDISYDVQLLAYEYPQDPNDGNSNRFGDTSEFILSLGMNGFGLTLVDALNSNDYKYYSLSFDTDQFGVLVGMNDDSDGTDDYPNVDVSYTHLDLNFYATEELTFTLSTIIDDDPEDSSDKDALFVVNWAKSFDL